MSILVFSDHLPEGVAKCGITFSSRGINLSNVREVAARIMVLLGAGDTVFLQSPLGNAISGGPVHADLVVGQVPFSRIAECTGETAEEVRRRLIIFSSAEEREEGVEHVIMLNEISPEDLELTELELWGIEFGRDSQPEIPPHPLRQILELAREASSG